MVKTELILYFLDLLNVILISLLVGEFQLVMGEVTLYCSASEPSYLLYLSSPLPIFIHRLAGWAV